MKFQQLEKNISGNKEPTIKKTFYQHVAYIKICLWIQ